MAWAVLFDGKMWYTYVQHRIYAAAENKRGFMNKEKHIIIAGGGAAGMIAAVAAAREGCKVSLYEKMKSWERSCLLQERDVAM